MRRPKATMPPVLDMEGFEMRRLDVRGARSHRWTWPGSLVVLMLLAGLVGPGVPSTRAVDPSPQPSIPAEGGWKPATLPAEPPVTLSVPGDLPNGLPLQPTFLLRRSDGGSLEAAVAGLTADPPAVLEVTGSSRDGVSLTPREPLRHATQYRFSTRDADGRMLGSWVFQTQGPPRIVSSIPGEWREDVPLTTAIEVTFDQPGVADLGPWWSVDPPVAGRFERRDRTVAFIPDAPLLPRTEYTVTLGAGLPVEATGETLEQDWTLWFMTVGDGSPQVRPLGAFARRVTETGTADAAQLEFHVERTRTRTVPVEVHRLPDAAAAIGAIRASQPSDGWERDGRSTDTASLPRVQAFDASLRRTDPFDSTVRMLALPEALDAGWYLVTVRDPAGDAQTVLQVSDLAAYAELTTTRSVVWVNDLRARGPVKGASVRVVGGPSLGTTDADGLLVAETPPALLEPVEPTILLVRAGGRAVLVPFGAGSWSSGDIWYPAGDGPDFDGDRAWSLLDTDRTRYRATDTVNAWGMVKDRETGTIPEDLTLRLDGWNDGVPVEVWSGPVTPTSFGMFAIPIALVDVPSGDYELKLSVGDTPVARAWFDIADIDKPSFQVELTTDRHIAIAGEPVEVTASASFFDGTHVPGVPLRLRSDESSFLHVTDARGEARQQITARPPDVQGQWSTMDITANVIRGEEGVGDATTSILVFRSANVLTGGASIEDGRAMLTGMLSAVDRQRLERRYDRSYELGFDPRGAPVPGRRVAARVIEETTVRVPDGSRFDWITRQVEPIYRFTTRERTLERRTLVSGPDGRFTLSFPVTAGHGYHVLLSATDAEGRITTEDIWAQRRVASVDDVGVYLSAQGANVDWWYPHLLLRPGERTTIEMRAEDRVQPAGGANRYLWLTSRLGLRSATVSRSPTLGLTMHAADAPLLEVSAVRFTGTTYLAAPDAFAVDFDPAGRALTVTLTPGRVRYGPGDTATLDVRVRDARGEPVVADVVLRAVDEKLFAMGLAQDDDPLEDLYRSVTTGTIATYASHQVPYGGHRGEGGDSGTEQGEARLDFRDQVLFRMVRTGRDGRATTSFPLSDDLTSWHIGATALTGQLQVGAGTKLLPVGLSFFVDLVMPSEVLVADQAGIRVRAYGSALRAGDRVAVTVAAPTLGMEPVEVLVDAFDEATVAFPPLSLGDHAVTVSARRVGGSRPLQDTLTRTLSVVESRLLETRTSWTTLDRPVEPPEGRSVQGFVVADTGRGASLPALLELAASDGTRADQVLAAAEARRRLVDDFGVDPRTLPAGTLDIDQFRTPSGGIALLPYGSSDLELSARVALMAPDTVDRSALERYLRSRLERRSGDIPPRELAQALAGLAGLGAPVAADVRQALAEQTWPARSLVWLGLAAAAAGDATTAREVERELLATRGQQQAPFLRMLDDRGTGDPVLTAQVGLLAAWIGDLATADGCDRYGRLDPSDATVLDLERLATAIQRATHAPADPARFAVTVGGERTEVPLEPGATWSIALLPEAAAGLRFEPLAGSLGLATTAQVPLDPATVTENPTIRLTRIIDPAPPLDPADVITVRLKLRLSEAALPGCYLVTELVPSGLAPVLQERAWRTEPGTIEPWRIDGQRVTFCAARDPERAVLTLRYQVRVITPGTYTWEPALVQSSEAPDVRDLGSATTVELR